MSEVEDDAKIVNAIGGKFTGKDGWERTISVYRLSDGNSGFDIQTIRPDRPEPIQYTFVLSPESIEAMISAMGTALRYPEGWPEVTQDE